MKAACDLNKASATSFASKLAHDAHRCPLAEHGQVLGTCLACSRVQPMVEDIFAIIKGFVGPDNLEETTAAKTFDRASRNPETQSQRRDTTCCQVIIRAAHPENLPGLYPLSRANERSTAEDYLRKQGLNVPQPFPDGFMVFCLSTCSGDSHPAFHSLLFGASNILE